MTKAKYEIEIVSPYGKQPLEQWEHWMRKVADESETRWGIEIQLTKQQQKDDVTEDFE